MTFRVALQDHRHRWKPKEWHLAIISIYLVGVASLPAVLCEELLPWQPIFPTKAVIGGSNISLPNFIKIAMGEGRHTCSGIPISSTHILTAPSCITIAGVNPLVYLIGPYSIEAQVYRVIKTEILRSRGNDDSITSDDIAILELRDTIPNVRRFHLANPRAYLNEDLTAIQLGKAFDMAPFSIAPTAMCKQSEHMGPAMFCLHSDDVHRGWNGPTILLRRKQNWRRWSFTYEMAVGMLSCRHYPAAGNNSAAGTAIFNDMTDRVRSRILMEEKLPLRHDLALGVAALTLVLSAGWKRLQVGHQRVIAISVMMGLGCLILRRCNEGLVFTSGDRIVMALAFLSFFLKMLSSIRRSMKCRTCRKEYTSLLATD